MCTTDRFATIFLESLVVAIAIVPKITETMPNTTKISAEVTIPDETTKQTKPTVANFSEYPARTTLPGQVASTCASGSQKESGKIGTFPRSTNDVAKVTSHEN